MSALRGAKSPASRLGRLRLVGLQMVWLADGAIRLPPLYASSG